MFSSILIFLIKAARRSFSWMDDVIRIWSSIQGSDRAHDYSFTPASVFSILLQQRETVAMAMASLNAFNLSSLASSLMLPERLASSSSVSGRMHAAMPAAQRTRPGAMRVVMMAKRQQELADVRNMSDEDINLTVVDLKGELFLLRTKQATRQEYKSSEFRRIRKQVARMLTVRREREIERGVTMRESRKLDRKWKQSIVVRPPPSYAATLAEQEKK